MFRFLLAAASLAALFYSCLALKNQVGNAVDKDEQFNSEQDFTVALIPVYQSLKAAFFFGGQFELSELSTDEAMIPTRGADWNDGGQWTDMYRHTWKANQSVFQNVWLELYIGVGRANRVLDELDAFPGAFATKARLRAELRVLRAYFYFRLTDYFGSVPLLAGSDFELQNLPSQQSRPALFAYVEQELLAAIPDLPETPEYGRVARGTAQALLAKLYLNAEVYTGQPRWSDALTQLNAVIASGQYSLTPDYFDNFARENDQLAEQEIMLPIVFDPNVLPGNGMDLHMRTLHYAQMQQFGLQAQPWNGYCTVQDFYNAFENNDLRKNAFLYGPQFNPDGSAVIDGATGLQLDFTPAVGNIFNAPRNAGVRVLKYEIASGDGPNGHPDLPLLRYADVLLMKAEAEYRVNNLPAALTVVNLVRARAGVPPLTSLTATDLLAERGRELFWETWRRNDMIRFGTFCNARDQKPASDCSVRALFPLPLPTLLLYPQLVQNPGY